MVYLIVFNVAPGGNVERLFITCTPSHKPIVLLSLKYDLEEAMLTRSSFHSLYEQYPDFYRQSFLLRPGFGRCHDAFLAWAAARSSHIEKRGSLWVADGLSEADVEWLLLHHIAIEECIEETLDGDDE